MADKKLDDIFEPTGAKPAAAKAAKAAKNGAKAAEKTAEAAPAQQPAALDASPFAVLKLLFREHGAEALYRRGREERAVLLSCALCGLLALIAAIVFGGPWNEAGWLWRLIFKLLLIAAAFLVASSGSKLIEVNRKRLQDLLGLQVKLANRLRLYEEGAYLPDGEPLYPGAFKFLGSLADDETNIGSLLVKGAFLFAALVVIFA